MKFTKKTMENYRTHCDYCDFHNNHNFHNIVKNTMDSNLDCDCENFVKFFTILIVIVIIVKIVIVISDSGSHYEDPAPVDGLPCLLYTVQCIL